MNKAQTIANAAADIADAAAAFIATHGGESGRYLADDTAANLRCQEAEAIAGLLAAFGDTAAAEYWLTVHAAGDDEGDEHYAEPADAAELDAAQARADEAAELAAAADPLVALLDAEPEPAPAAPLLWIEYTDASGYHGAARWGGLTDAQIDATLAAAVATIGEPHTID